MSRTLTLQVLRTRKYSQSWSGNHRTPAAVAADQLPWRPIDYGDFSLNRTPITTSKTRMRLTRGSVASYTADYADGRKARAAPKPRAPRGGRRPRSPEWPRNSDTAEREACQLQNGR